MDNENQVHEQQNVNSDVAVKQKGGFFGKLVGLKPDTSIKTEIIAGITTFFAMCYIILVNPNQITGFYRCTLQFFNALNICHISACLNGSTHFLKFFSKFES